jgi:hypothetical protein
MFKQRSITTGVQMHALAILATALMACGSISGAGSAGGAATIGSDTPSDIRLTEFEYEGQATTPTLGPPVELGHHGTSGGVPADTYPIP